MKGRGKRYSIPLGLLAAGISMLFYVLLPYAIKMLIKDPSMFGIDADPSGIDFSGVVAMLDRAMLLSPVMAVLSFIVGFHRRGDKNRVYAQIVRMVASYVGFLFIINFGNLGKVIGFDSDGSEFEVEAFFTGVIGVMALLNLLKIPIFYGEYRDNREDFLAKYDPDGYELFVMGHYEDEDYGYGPDRRRRIRWG